MEKPTVRLIGEDMDIFNLMGIASRALREAGQIDKSKEMTNKIANEVAKFTKHTLAIIMEYCEVE